MRYVDPLKGQMNINDATMTKKCTKPSRKHFPECHDVVRKCKYITKLLRARKQGKRRRKKIEG